MFCGGIDCYYHKMISVLVNLFCKHLIDSTVDQWPEITSVNSMWDDIAPVNTTPQQPPTKTTTTNHIHMQHHQGRRMVGGDVSGAAEKLALQREAQERKKKEETR